MLSNNPLEAGTKFHSILNNEAEVKQQHNLFFKRSNEGQFSQLTTISEILTLVHLMLRPICRQIRRDLIKQFLIQRIKSIIIILKEEELKLRNF